MKYPLIRKIYLYLFSFIGLALITVGAVSLVTLGLKVYLFKEADQISIYPASYPAPLKAPGGSTQPIIDQKALDAYNQTQQRSQRERDAATAVAQLIIGLPLYLYHWVLVRRENKSED